MIICLYLSLTHTLYVYGLHQNSERKKYFAVIYLYLYISEQRTPIWSHWMKENVQGDLIIIIALIALVAITITSFIERVHAKRLLTTTVA